jgi:hypothetical protein
MIAAGILALLAALLVPTGIQMARAFDHDGLAACLGVRTSEGCAAAVDSFTSRFQGVADLTSWFTLVPGLVGVLLAAPFVAELETGTYRLAWTQSITRRRWVATKLATTVGAVLLVTGAITLLITWWRAPFVRLEGRLENGVYDVVGTVAVGYALFAVGLALAAGVVWRRTVPALIVAFMGYVAARIFVDAWLRQRFASPLSATWRAFVPGADGHPRGGAPPTSLHHAWVLDAYPSDRFGHPLAALGNCVRPIGDPGGTIKCFAGQGWSHVVFHPADRFWLFQGIETAMFGGIGLALVGLAAWWTLRRTA